MRTAEIPVEAELVEKLADSFDSGPIIDDSGRRFLEEQTVGAIKGLKVLIFADEHPPPHFCVELKAGVPHSRSRIAKGCPEIKAWSDSKETLESGGGKIAPD